MIAGTDIEYVLSGGTNNSDPKKSLGGDRSQAQVGNNTPNGIFSDVSVDDSQSGLIDYRCIYVFNNSTTDYLYNTEVKITSQVGYDIKFGLPTATDVQQITITGNPVGGGYFTVDYDNLRPVQINYDSNMINWANNIKTALLTYTLNGTPLLSGIRITSDSTFVNSVLLAHFVIYFEGNNNNTNQPKLIINNDYKTTLFGGNPQTSIKVDKVSSGGPINTIASPVANAKIAPANIIFSTTDVSVGTLGPMEGFPIWFQRVITPNAAPIKGDGFVLLVAGSPLPSST